MSEPLNVFKIRDDLNNHIEDFKNYKASQEYIIDLVQDNKSTNECLRASLEGIEKNTKPLIQLHNDLAGAGRVAKYVMFMATFTGFCWTIFNYLGNVL